MDTNPIPTMSDDESERRLLEIAVEKSRLDPRPSIPDEVIRAKIGRKMEDLKVKIAALTTK